MGSKFKAAADSVLTDEQKTARDGAIKAAKAKARRVVRSQKAAATTRSS